MTDREQTRRDAEQQLKASWVHQADENLPNDLARHILALLAELEQADERIEARDAQIARQKHDLEQAERERDEAIVQSTIRREQLAKVPALLEALRGYHELAPRIAEYLNDVGAMLAYSDYHRANVKAEEALAVWEEK